MAHVCSLRLLPTEALLILRAASRLLAARASLQGTGNTLDLRALPKTPRANRSQGRTGTSAHGKPIGASISTWSASEDAFTKSQILVKTPCWSPARLRVTANQPPLHPSTPTCRIAPVKSPNDEGSRATGRRAQPFVSWR